MKWWEFGWRIDIDCLDYSFVLKSATGMTFYNSGNNPVIYSSNITILSLHQMATHTYTPTHIHTHKYTHTYIYIYIYIYVRSKWFSNWSIRPIHGTLKSTTTLNQSGSESNVSEKVTSTLHRTQQLEVPHKISYEEPLCFDGGIFLFLFFWRRYSSAEGAISVF